MEEVVLYMQACVMIVYTQGSSGTTFLRTHIRDFNNFPRQVLPQQTAVAANLSLRREAAQRLRL
jgi:hypothetical protein